MKNNQYRGILGGVGYLVAHNKRIPKREYHAYILLPNKGHRPDLSDRPYVVLTHKYLDALDANRNIQHLQQEFGKDWLDLIVIKFEAFPSFKEASDFAAELCRMIAIVKKSETNQNPDTIGDESTENLTEKLNDVTLAGPIFKSKEKNNKYYGVIDGIGYAVSRPIKRKYYAFLLRNADDRIRDWRAFSPSGELVKNFYKICTAAANRTISTEDDFSKLCKLNTVLALRKAFGNETWNSLKFFRFGEFDSFKEASEFIRDRVMLQNRPVDVTDVPEETISPMNDVTLRGSIFKSKEKTDEFLKKVKDDLNSRYGTMSEKIVEVNKAKSELNSVYGRKAFLSGPVPWDKLNTMEIQFDGMGGALVKFRNRFIALLMVNDIRYISNDVITFNSEYVQSQSWSTTNPDGSGITVEISFDPDPNFATGYIKLKRTK